ncbi:DUF5688 family protein [Oribacterium sp. WCC10]|uniref:DUF5688 family protein n=1 Tax=Oribacterium sp. WCC10 TaxID=1855343 RepID=UPI0008E71FB8|nr:DUF5688 family protein [Oribacterium sp. WCC10]SFG26583.1 hypothetical protein SAMN05216356_104155 [Oribacterium sp. WCC10]
MITKEMVLSELKKNGHEAELCRTVKNGVVMEAIVIRGEGNCSPSIYIDELIKEANEKEQSVSDLASQILRIAENHRCADFDTELLKRRDFVLGNVYIAIQKKSEEPLIKRDCGFEGLECYLYLRVMVAGASGSIKMNEAILKLSGITEDEAWECAEKNICGETLIQPMFEALSGMMGKPVRDMECIDSDKAIYVITNKNKIYGASAILDKGSIKNLSEKCGISQFIVIPSSRHEMLLVPDVGGIELDRISDMVREVNETMVDPVDRLTDVAYRMTA